MNFDEFLQLWTNLREAFPHLFAFGLNTIAALLILIFGWTIARWVKRRVKGSKIGGSHVDSTLRPIVASSIFYVIIAMTLYAVLRKIGVDAASLLAVFGAAGLAIGLALKDTLSNIAAGIMILFLRPLKVGEFIETSGFSGNVQELGLFATTLKNAEGLYVYVPNRSVWNAQLTNFSRHAERKLVISLRVGFTVDLESVRALLLNTLNEHPHVKTDTAEVYVMEFGESAITLSCRAMLASENWLARTSDVRMAVKAALDKNNIKIALPQSVVMRSS